MIDTVQIPGYRILRTLGVGGMATVYLAEQRSLERDVALKVMAPTLAASPDFCEQFLKEGRITAKLSHQNLVTVHDIGSHAGTYYMASEYLPAGSLRERLQGALPAADALCIARDVASGLTYAHEMGFVHRDVKPGNILFRANGSAVLADFGIAKAIKSVSSATMAGNAIGTPDYMSPEQAQASPVDGRTDLYSLGAVLYEMLSGGKPYTAHDPYAVALRHITDPVPRLPEALAWLQPVIDRLMAKDREQRYASGAEFIAECDALMAGHPEITLSGVAARRFATPPPYVASPLPKPEAAPAPSASRVRWKRLAPAVAAAVLLAVAVLAWRSQQSSPRPPEPVAPHAAPEPLPGPVPDEPVPAAGLARLDMSTLLARAGQYLDEGLRSDDGRHLSFPDGDNAIDLYREVIRREPGNAIAAQGLSRIADFYARGAQRTFERGLDTFTQDLVEKGLRAKPDDPALLKLKNELAARAGGQNG